MPHSRTVTAEQIVERTCRKIAFAHCIRQCIGFDEYGDGEPVDEPTLIQSTRLWNWIDQQANPEPLWEIMLREVPFVFRDADDTNSIRFAYATTTTFSPD